MFAAYADKAGEASSLADEADDKGPDKKLGTDWLENSSYSISKQVEPVQGSQSLTVKAAEDSFKHELVGEPAVSSSRHANDSDSPETPPGSPTDFGYSLLRSNVQSYHDHSTPPSSSSDSELGHEKKRGGRSRKLKHSRRSSSESSKEDGKGRKERRPRSKDNDRRAKDAYSKNSKKSRSQRRSRSKSRGKSKKRNRSRSRKRTGKERSRSRSASRRKDESRKRSSKSHFGGGDMNNEMRHTQGDCTRFDSQVLNMEDVFYQDKTRSYGNLNVPTLTRPAVAIYHASRNGIGVSSLWKPRSKKWTLKHRYYNRVLKDMEGELERGNASSHSENEERKATEETNESTSTRERKHDLEEELSKTTAKYNRDLADDTHNVELWKKYVEFQDVMHQFERVYRRGGGAVGARLTAERKLAILEKALEANPGCKVLLQDWCLLAESVLPSDKLKLQLKRWVEADPGNLVLWEALIMTSQGSLSSCQVPVVKSLYQQALKAIQGLLRSNSNDTPTVESKITDLLLHLGLFLRQAGLLELLWSLLHVYLEFNIAKLDSSKLNITSTVADAALTELEDAIFSSQLPMPTLWHRVEALRAGTHWVSLPAQADSEDPQRLVFPEDVNDLIHPIRTPHLNFRLITITLSLLKIPLLPWRENAARACGLHPLPWLMDGPELLYASLFQLGTLEFKETSNILQDAVQLACGPQYLIARPGQDEYIDFVSQVFSGCADCLPTAQQTLILVWWLRFYRWLMQLERFGHCKLPRGRSKKMRTTAKDLLRKDCNRNNLLLFQEFALLEREMGNLDSSKKVLFGAIGAQPKNKPVPISVDRAAVCALYRTLVELHLSESITQLSKEGSSEQTVEKGQSREKAISLLVSLGIGTPLNNYEKSTKEQIEAAVKKYHHVLKELVNNPLDGEVEPLLSADVCHLSPSFLVEWTACYGWLLFLTNSIWKAATVFENVLSDISKFKTSTDDNYDETPTNLGIEQQTEGLLEIYIILLRHHCHETLGSYGILRDVVLRALKKFPGNFYFLAALADLESSSSGTGLPLWRLSRTFYELNSAPAHALLVFVMRHRLKLVDTAAREACVFLQKGGPEVPDPNIRSRMTSLLLKLTKNPVMRRCPLLWRLRLQFAAATNSKDEACHNTFYLALEECPWVKALYMDVIQVLPMQLPQVQDLLIEKELRLHVTPEELEILRSD